MSSRLTCRTGRRTDSRLPPSLSRVTSSAVSEHSSELLGCPISRSLTTSCVGLELRLLPSTGITRFHRCYGPLTHPCQPSPEGHRVGLHIVLFEAFSAFSRVAACTLARSPYFVTRFPKASDISSPPCLLRLLPAGAVAGWDLHPLESAAFSRRTPFAEIRLKGFNDGN